MGQRYETRKQCLKNELFFFFDFPGGPEDKNMPANAGGMDLIPGQGTRPDAAKKN